MEMIIGGSLTPLNSSWTMGSVRRRDDNSRAKVQNVCGDSSACRQGQRVIYRRIPRLFPELTLAQGDGTYPTVLARFARVDVLILGCTHYTLLKPAIAQIMGTSATLIDSSQRCAEDVALPLEAKCAASASATAPWAQGRGCR